MFSSRATFLFGLFFAVPSMAQGVPPSAAREQVTALESLLKKRKTTNETLIAAVDAVETSMRNLEPAGEGAAAKERLRALQAAEKALLKALVLKRVPRDSKENERHPVQMRAARALRHARPEAAGRLRQAVERRILGADYEPHLTLYEAVFFALVRIDAEGSVPWLVDKPINAQWDPDSMNRTLAGFAAIGRARNLSGETRREIVKRILSLYQSFTFHVKFDYYDVASFRGIQRMYKIMSGAGPYWVVMKPIVLGALRNLSIDPRSGLPPFDIDTGLEIETISRFKVWFGLHKRPGRAPWLNPKRKVEPQPRSTSVYVRPIPPVWRRFGIPWTTWWERNRRLPRPGAPATGEAAGGRPEMIALRRKRLPPLLVQALADPEPEVRAAAAMTAGKLKVKGAVSFLRERMARDASETVREAAMLGLLLLRDPSLLPYFRAAFENEEENPRVRAYAALALGLLGDQRSFEGDALVGMANEDLQACMTRAIAFFGKKGQAADLVSWIGAARGPSAIRGHAGTALRQVGGPDQAGALLKVLRAVRVKSDRHVSQCAAALAIPAAVNRGDAKALKAIRNHLERSEGRFAGTRTRLALSLGRIGGPEAESILIHAYEAFRDKSTRYAERGHFLLAIGLVGSKGAREFLRAEFEKLDHEFDAAACALALALAKDKTAISSIRSRLYDSKGEFTPHGMMALALLGDKTAAAPIRDRLERRGGPRIRAEGGLALARLLRGGARSDLVALWERCGTAAELDACAYAFAITNDASVAAPLLSIWRDTTQRTPLERAFAVVALGRLADPDRDPLLARFARDFHPYAVGPTLTLLARHRDVPFLH